MIEEIGRGAEGSVWRGRWQHIDVAVKEMHPRSLSFNRLARCGSPYDRTRNIAPRMHACMRPCCGMGLNHVMKA